MNITFITHENMKIYFHVREDDSEYAVCFHDKPLPGAWRYNPVSDTIFNSGLPEQVFKVEYQTLHHPGNSVRVLTALLNSQIKTNNEKEHWTKLKHVIIRNENSSTIVSIINKNIKFFFNDKNQLLGVGTN